jgi:copper resistance protein D
MMTWLVLARAVHFASCLLLFGVCAFDRLVAAFSFANSDNEAADYWKRRVKRFGIILAPVILVSGIAWFVLVAASMGGVPLPPALQSKLLGTVWSQTQFGTVCKWRLIFWLMSASAAALSLFKTAPQKSLVWIQWGCGTLLLGSLAWAGHGSEDSHWHLLADVFHLLMAGIWPAGLVPFLLLLSQLRRGSEPKRWGSIAALVRRFSALSLAVAAVLALTGFVNAWFLVGSVSNLFGQMYGRWLLAKIVLFGIAIVIGALNLLRLKPRLLAEGTGLKKSEATAAQLEFNVKMELLLGTAIVVVVAVLGILPPANH